MNVGTADWEAVYRGHKIVISKRKVGMSVVYYVSSSPEKKPLVITKAAQRSGKEFWTSVPQGMQREAEEIGQIIEKLEQ